MQATERRDPKSVQQYEAEKWMSGERWGQYVADGGETVTMFRRRNRVRFYTADGRQIGPEQPNVAPAIAFTMVHGWKQI